MNRKRSPLEPRASTGSRHLGPLLTALAVMFLVACAGGEPDGDVTRPKHVLLISLDTLRADHCSLYGYPRPTTPFLAELGARGVVFENHMANSNSTLTSHATMMTGLYPQTHDTYDRGTPDKRQALAGTFLTLAEAFAEAGYATAAFNTHPLWLGEEFGVMSGFQHLASSDVDAPTKMGEFLDWYDAHRPERMFAFLHFYDAHSEPSRRGGGLPYESTEALVAEFAGERPPGFTGCLREREDRCASLYLQGISNGEESLPPDHLEFLKGLYDAGIRKLDDDLRRFFGELEERGLLEDSLVVLTSDHGEDLMEHDTLLHGSYYDEVMHVPLIVLLPGQRELARLRVPEPTRMVDLAPTLLDFAGLAAIGQGNSLKPVILDAAPVPDTEVFFSPTALRARDDEGLFKMVEFPRRPVFFDLEADPGEHHNVFEHPELLERHEERIAAARERVRVLRQAAFEARDLIKKESEAVEMDPEAIEELRALGYLGESD